MFTISNPKPSAPITAPSERRNARPRLPAHRWRRGDAARSRHQFRHQGRSSCRRRCAFERQRARPRPRVTKASTSALGSICASSLIQAEGCIPGRIARAGYRSDNACREVRRGLRRFDDGLAGCAREFGQSNDATGSGASGSFEVFGAAGKCQVLRPRVFEHGSAREPFFSVSTQGSRNFAASSPAVTSCIQCRR